VFRPIVWKWTGKYVYIELSIRLRVLLFDFTEFFFSELIDCSQISGLKFHHVPEAKRIVKRWFIDHPDMVVVW